jgi:hypothetical protein
MFSARSRRHDRRAWVLGKLVERFASERSQKVTVINPGEAATDEPRAALEIERNRDGCCAGDVFAGTLAGFSEELEQDVATE